MYRYNMDSDKASLPQAAVDPEDVECRQTIKLTTREKEVLQWSAAGKSSWEIGKIVSCTESGVNYHFCNIRRKFGVRSRWTAMVMALEQGLIQMP